MSLLGVGISKEVLFEIAARANVRITDTPSLNVVRVNRAGPTEYTAIKDAAHSLGYTTEWGSAGVLLIKEA